jgi:4-hydroxybenzoate polyprenyltransferase
MKKNTVHDYVVVLKNHNRKTIEMTGWLLSVLAIIIFLVNIYESPTDWGIFSSLFILIGLLASNIVDKRKKKKTSFFFTLRTFFGFLSIVFLLSTVISHAYLH